MSRAVALNHVSLFTGYGGFELAFRLAGINARTILYCDIEPFAHEIIKARIKDGYLDDAPIWSDIRTLNLDTFCQLLYDCCDSSLQEDIMARALDPKYDNAVELYQAGFSIGEVADYYGVTRQSMWQVLKARKCVFRSNLKMGIDNHFFRGTSADDRAQNMVEKAIKRGALEPKPCEVCGANGCMADGRREVQAHHDDYNKPLQVRWLCQEHHHAWHITNKAMCRKEVMPDGSLQAIETDILTGGFP